MAVSQLGFMTVTARESSAALPRGCLVSADWGTFDEAVDRCRRRSTAAGSDLHLVKPVDPTALQALLVRDDGA
jgi:hypothetical protein